MFFGIKTFFDDPQGLAVVRLLSWDNQKISGDDDEVTVYGVNSGKGQIIFNTSMYGLDLWGEKGSGVSQLLYPKGIAANDKGYVFIADSGNNRIVKLFNPKSKLEWKCSFNGASSQDHGLVGPSRIAIDEHMLVYANDKSSKRIVVFDSNGILQKMISPGFVSTPTALAIADGNSTWSNYRDEYALFCADKDGTIIWKINKNGDVVAKTVLPEGYSASYGATDYYHNYYVTDLNKHCIIKLDHNLKILDIFGSYGSGKNQFFEPRGIAIYKRFGQTFIAEKKGAQYYWVGTCIKSCSITRTTQNKFILSLTATEHSFISLYTLNHEDTVLCLNRVRISAGQSSIELPDLKNDLSSNSSFTLTAEATYSSLTYRKWSYLIKVK